MIDKLEKNECTGCKLCGDVCPMDAITFVTDKEGFWYPQIERDKCTNCGICENMCPSCSQAYLKPQLEPKVYAAWSKDCNIRYESTSGGIFWEIASEFIKSGGVVAGCRWGDDWKSANHVIAHNINELLLLRGSKYIQSDTAGIYKIIKKELYEGRKVLFCGTPCQNAALKMYLQGVDERIYYLDFICRSINSPLAFKSYIDELEKNYNSKVKEVHLKNKKKGWKSLASQVVFENGQESLKDRDDDYWIKGFLGGDLFTRNSCTNCNYRCIPRKTSDITIGDFWGIKDASQYDMFRGISVVLINSDKGEQLFKQSVENLQVITKSLEEVKLGNFALLKSPTISEKKRIFFESLKLNSFSKSVFTAIGVVENLRKISSPDEEFKIDEAKYTERGTVDRDLYLYLNFNCKNIIRRGKGKIIPYKNTVLDMQETARIIIEGDLDFEIGTNLLKGSRAETLVRLHKYSTWKINHGGYLYYGTTLELKENAIFKTGYFSANTGSVIIAEKRIIFGEDVMIGRNVTIYDSDFHQILNDDGVQCNSPSEVIIEDHVWLTANINIHKGLKIGQGSIVTNQTVLVKDVPPYSVVAGQSVGRVINSNASWSRNPVKKYKHDIDTKLIILYGFGVKGKKIYEKYLNKIAFVIDNYVDNDIVRKFSSFKEEHTDLDVSKYIWVIAAPNYYDEIYNQIRVNYLDSLILPYDEI